MSSICGIYYFNNQSVMQSELCQMTLTMAPLSPDGFRIWHANHVGFGHKAFHLTDDAMNETLPYFDPTLKIAITADCRLDNRAFLCTHFQLKNEPSISDSFLILLAYQRWGKDCPTYLLGEFAVVIWDEQTQEMICFTDHTGQRTVYYYLDENMFAFATDIHALHTLPCIPREPNLERIAAHGNLSYLLTHPEITFYKHIFKASSRTLFSIKNKRINRQQYWRPDINHRIYFSSEDEYIEAFQDLFSTIIRDKFRSQYPVLTLHSGGLDSSAITAMSAYTLQKEGKKLTALSAVLPSDYLGKTTDESHYIHLLQNPNLHIHTVTDTWRGPFDGLDDRRQWISEPNKTSRDYLYKAFATAASNQGARTILDGCFGEKGPSFHGNGYFAELLLAFRWRTLFRESCLHMKHYHRPLVKFAFREGLMPLLPANMQAKMSLRSDITFSQQYSLIKPDFINAHYFGTSFKKDRAHLNTQYPNHRRHQLQAMNYLHANQPVVQDDHGQPIYFSYPYNDKRMLEFCLALPGNLKVRHGYKRYAIRSGMRGLMPDELRFRTTKEPFSPDFHDRFNRQLIKAREFVASVTKTPLMNEIIDIPRLTSALDVEMKTNRCSTPQDFSAMHTIPFAIYLMSFLATFE